MKSCVPYTIKELAKHLKKNFSQITKTTEDGYIFFEEGTDIISKVNEINEYLGGEYIDVYTTENGKMIAKISPNLSEKYNIIDLEKAQEILPNFENINGNYFVTPNGWLADIDRNELYSAEEDPFEQGVIEDTLVGEYIDRDTEKKIKGAFKTIMSYIDGRIGELKKRLSVIEQRIKHEQRKGNIDEVDSLYDKIAEIKDILERLKSMKNRLGKFKPGDMSIENIFSITNTIAKLELNYADKLIDSGQAEYLSKAKEIIDYYIKLGEIKVGQEHPLFDREVIEKLADSVNGDELYHYKEQLRNIGNKALDLHNKLQSKKSDIIEKLLTSDKSLLEILDKFKKSDSDKLIDLLRRPLEDISIYDMMMHDISTVVFSRDSLLAQVIKKTAMDIMEEEHGNIVELLDRFSELQDRVEAKLEKHGIPGFKGHNYTIFFQKDKYGFLTGRLIGPFKYEWYVDLFSKLREYDLYSEKYVPDRDNWIDKNADKIDLTKIKAIRDRFFENDLFTDDNGNSVFKYSEEEMQEYEQELKRTLGEKYFENIINDSITAIEEFIAQAKIYEHNIARTQSEEKKKKLAKDYEIFIRRYNPVLASISNNFEYDGEMYSRFLDGVFLMPKNRKYFEEDFFNKIAVDQDLYNMWSVLYEGFSYVSQSFSDATISYSKDNIPGLKKTFLEMIIGQGKSGVLDNAKEAKKQMLDMFKKSIRSNEEKFIEAKDKYGINKNFYDNKKEEINALRNRYLDRWKELSNNKVEKTVSFSQLSAKQIEFLQEITGLNKTELRNRFGKTFNIRNVLYSIARQNIVLQYSTDIPMIFRVSVNMAAEYNARVKMKPVIDILIEEYKQIERKREEQGGSKFERWIAKITGKNERSIERERAIKRMEWWYDKAVRGQFDTKQKGLFKGIKGFQYDDKKWLRGLFRFLATGKIYTADEKRAIKPLEKSMDKIKDKVIAIIKKQYQNLEDQSKVIEYNSKIDRVRKYGTIKLNKDKLTEEEKKILKQWNTLAYKHGEIGANFTLSAFFNSVMSFLIFKGLAYNINSAVRNRAEGWLANMIMDSTGRFWTPGNMAFANYFMIRAYKTRLAPTSNEAKQWKIFDHFMVDYRILQDASNELQRNSVRSSIKNLEKTSPYYLSVSAIEKRNQGAIVLSILMDMKIKDINGKEYPIFDGKEFTAFDIKNGRLVLKDNFRRPENVETWEKQRSKEFIEFKRKVEKAIVHTHGDYTQLGGMWIKQQDWGRALMMFRTWLPQYIWQRFAKYQHDIIAGIEHKGRFRSFTPTTGALAGAVGGILMGPAFSALGATIGFVWSVSNGIHTDINAIKELVNFSKLVIKQWLNIPASLLGKRIYDIEAEEIQKYFSGNKKMSKLDAYNLAANAQEIAIMLWLLLLKMLIKSIGWDDEDDKKKKNWQWRTYLVLENHITNLIETGSQWANPKIFFDNNSSVSFIRWLQNVIQTVDYIQDTFEGDPYMKQGPYKGELKLMRQAHRLFIPTFADGFMFGFKSPSLQDYSKSDFFDKLFKSGKK